MWVPVLESRSLGAAPRRVMYWGSPLVVFRTESGRLGALEDACGHRAVPLSTGVVRGEALRCGFHHFAFGTDGTCVAVPPGLGIDAEAQRGCRTRRLFVREALDLIWISIEDGSFPLEELDLPAPVQVITGAFQVRGDLRVWMDHFLDGAHCLWTHAETAYGGTADRPAALESIEVGIRPDSRYPVRAGVKMTYRLSDEPPAAKYSAAVRLFSTAARLRRALRRRRGPGPARTLDIRADLLTPLCQYTSSTFRTGRSQRSFEGVTGINPLGEDRHEFVFAGFFRDGAQGLWARLAEQQFLERFVPQHLGAEDGPLLAEAAFVPSERLLRSPIDQPAAAMRAMFASYLAEKGHLYPPGSLIHRLAYA